MKRSFVVVLMSALVAGLAGPDAVASQFAPGMPGITTIGYGEATAAAESASMEVIIFDSNSFMGPPPLPEAEATPGATARGTAGPIADAIAAIEGVENIEIVVPQVANPFGAPVPLARITFTVANPDHALLQELVTAAAQAAASDRLSLAHVGARFETSDCASLEREARQAALDDARRQAEAQAEVLSVGLGEVVATSDVNSLYGPFGIGSGCGPEAPAESFGDPAMGITLPPLDPTRDSAEIEVYRQVQVTFAIGDGAATPAA